MPQSPPPFHLPDPGFQGDPRRGAGFGRVNGKLRTEAGRVHLEQVPIDAAGYDRGGAYWGSGRHPVWCAWQGREAVYFRAPNREAAKAEIRTHAPALEFFN